MTIALGLLISAMQLLAIVSANPLLPQSFRDNAIVIANHAITTAQAELAKSPEAPAPAIIAVTNQPSFGAIPQTTTHTIQSMPEKIKEITLNIGQAGESDGVVSYEISAVYTENGQPVNGVPITITVSDAPTHTIDLPNGKYYGRFTNLNPQDTTSAVQERGGLYASPLTIKTHKHLGKDGTIYAMYTPSSENVSITVEANGKTDTKTAPGQK